MDKTEQASTQSRPRVKRGAARGLHDNGNFVSVESQKGVITDQRCSVENQKGAIAIHFVQQ